MKQSKGELRVTVGFQMLATIDNEKTALAGFKPLPLQPGVDTDRVALRGFTCSMEGAALQGAKFDFYILPHKGRLTIFPFTTLGNSPLKRVPMPLATWIYVEEFAPIARVIETYEMTEAEAKQIAGFFSTDLPAPIPKKLAPEALDYFGDLLIRILKEAGYRPRLQKISLLPKRWTAPTVDASAQRFFTADKTGNILAELIALRKQKDIPLQYDPTGQNVIGLKVTLNIPGKRAIEEDAQLTFGFGEKDGFKVIPVNDLDKPEVTEELWRTFHMIEKGICKEMDALALRVKDALLCLAQDKRKWDFYLEENELLDLLFERDQKGYHSTGNRKNVAQRLILLHESKWGYALKIGRETWGIQDAPYIILNPDGRAFMEITEKKGKKTVRYDFQSVRISKPYQDLFSEAKYLSQHDREALKLQQAAYSLYKYISQWWRISWQKDRGVYKWFHNDVLEGAGVAVPRGSQRARDLRRIEGYYQEMKEKGFIKDYGRLLQNKDPIADKWFWEAPDELKAIYRGMGLKYDQQREIKDLKREKKRLKLRGEVIELKKKDQ